MLKLALVFAIFISGVKCGYYFVILPNVIRYNHSETVTVSVFELEKAQVKIWLKHGRKLFSNKTVVVQNEKNPVSATVIVTENDLFDTVVKDKPRNIDVCSEYDGKSQCREILLSYQTGYLIVQTDKPIYTPLNKVTVRTLALDESLRAVDGWQVGMDIISPNGITMARRTFDKSPSGFFQNEFRLPPYPDIGIWTARSFYRGQFETESRTLFEVQEYVLPTFDVTIEVDVPYILDDTDEIKITVRAMYVYRKPVEGNARLTLSLRNESGDTEHLFNIKRRKKLQYDGKSSQGSAIEFVIKIDTIMNSTYLSGKDFPDRSHLVIDAMVYEDATGKEEASTHDGIMFVVEPYIFIFTRSKLIFKPGWEYNLKVDVLYANEQPASRKNIEVRMYKHGELHSSKNATTDDQGKVAVFFETTANDRTLTFKIVTRDNRHASKPFNVNGYEDDNQLIAEHVIKDNTMTLRAYTNMKPSGSTGLLFMVVTRGKVVLTKFKETTNLASEILPEDIQELISPSARLLVFYVDKITNKLVADSDKFHLVQRCRDKGLKLKTLHSQVLPGASDFLTVEGDPRMWVGLNVMDKALLILNNKNVLRKNKMFQVLESHDLGCGAGSGRNGADVFMKTGLTVLTDAVLSANDLRRASVGCEGSKRKKRETGECYYGANIRCCEKAYEVAEKILYEADSPKSLDPYTKCYAEARELVNKFPMRCVMAFLTSCITELEILITDKAGIESRSFGEGNDYQLDLASFADVGYRFKTRNNFRESWLFEVNQLDSSGQLQKILNYPDSITEWMIQAIGVTSSKGVCIADPVNVTAFRDFFIQLDLPYEATRLEQFDVKATIFNYGHANITANIYLEGAQHLCYNSEPGIPSPRKQINLTANSAQTVRFPVIPLKKGLFYVKVSAFVVKVGIPFADVVEKKLYVVNEGIEEKRKIQVCLDPNNQMEDCKNDDRVYGNDPFQSSEPGRVYKVDLTLPHNSTPGTGSATAYIQGNLMDNVVRIVIGGVDSLIKLPTGCGEQMMATLAPTVYSMMYLKETHQITEKIEIEGYNFIRQGVDDEVSGFRKKDGSFSRYKHVPSSTWLTAFVAKVFCQAKRFVDDAVNETDDIAASINWLKNSVKQTGEFFDDNPVIYVGTGQVGAREPSLTAFVLIALLECDIRDKDVNQTIIKAMNFLENLDESELNNNPHLLAISTYALAMANSEKKSIFKNRLHKLGQRNGNDIYWGTPGGNPANANSVETTAYALLAMMEFNDWKTCAKIVRWLTSQRDSAGAFRSTQDTVVALQALSKYNIKSYSPDVDLDIEVFAQGSGADQFKISRENAGVQHILKQLPVEHKDNSLTVRVTGTGTGIMIIDLRYNRPATEEEGCPFEISPIEINSIDLHIDKNIANEDNVNCDVCGYCEGEPAPDNYEFESSEEDQRMESNLGRRKREADEGSKDKCIKFSVRSKSNKKFGMSIVNFGLETGMEVVQDDLKKLMEETQNIESYEVPSSGKGFVVFYLKKITLEKTQFIFRLKDRFEGDIYSRHSSSVKVYDYYNPDQSCSQFYGTGPNQAQGQGYECEEEQVQCKCLQSMCAQPVEEKLLKFARKKQLPALKLYRHTCNAEKADYAVFVSIESTDYSVASPIRTATGKVLKSLHQGEKAFEVEDEIEFVWNDICDHIDIEKGGEYYIIGKDGYNVDTGEGKRYMYPLMDTTLVIRNGQDKLLTRIMKNYEKLLKSRNGCSN